MRGLFVFREPGRGVGCVRAYLGAMNDTDWLRKRLRNPRAGCLVLTLPAFGALFGAGLVLAALSLGSAAG